MLNDTEVPLFFLCTQLAIAVILFMVAHIVRIIQLPLEFDLQVIKGLVPMVGLNVLGLRYVYTFGLISYTRHTQPLSVSATIH